MSGLTTRRYTKQNVCPWMKGLAYSDIFWIQTLGDEVVGESGTSCYHLKIYVEFFETPENGSVSIGQF